MPLTDRRVAGKMSANNSGLEKGMGREGEEHRERGEVREEGGGVRLPVKVTKLRLKVKSRKLDSIVPGGEGKEE